jgi:Domain of unknown function (DUF5664)
LDPNLTRSLDTDALVRVSANKESLKTPKLGLNLIVPQFVEGLAQVLDFGKVKYGAHNWMKGLPFSEVIAATKRHILAIEVGEEKDPETDEPHELHAACELMFLNWYLHSPESGDYRTRFDDRLFKRVQ